MHLHPERELILRSLRKRVGDLVSGFSGPVFRFTHPAFSRTKDLFAGKGPLRANGRWLLKGRIKATYEKARVLPKTVQRPVTETVRLIKALRELAGDDTALKDWLTKPNQAFGRRTPLALIEAGESDILWQMIHQLRQGEFA